jgi:hypothetical protein
MILVHPSSQCESPLASVNMSTITIRRSRTSDVKLQFNNVIYLLRSNSSNHAIFELDGYIAQSWKPFCHSTMGAVARPLHSDNLGLAFGLALVPKTNSKFDKCTSITSNDKTRSAETCTPAQKYRLRLAWDERPSNFCYYKCIPLR